MFKMIKRVCVSAAILALIPLGGISAQDIAPDNWELSENGAKIVNYLGRKSIELNGGISELKGVKFQNGTISFDIAMQEKRGFAGVYFRRNNNSSEYFYLRPHMSGNPDSNQYTPHYNGVSGWQLYHSPRFSAPTVYKFDRWLPVKLVIKDNKMDVYIDSDVPVLHVADLMGPKETGSIRIAGGFQEFRFSNFKVEANDNVVTIGTPAPKAKLPETLIKNFSVASTAVLGSAVEGTAKLDTTLLEGQVWQNLVIDEVGVGNLAKVSGRTPEINTLLVRKILIADEAKTVRFQYGFSDRVTVFLNGKAIAYGDDRYLSRDYRHLGTIGLYDSVFLPLKAGRNELIFAVTEGFGGWGIKAAMEPVSGVQVN